MQIFRRFLVIAAVSFWLGGFTFYASVVVPVGQQVLGSHLRQGLITQQVTHFLNLSGALALLVFAWDNLAAQNSQRRLARWLTWLGMAALLPVLMWLHQRLDLQFDSQRGEVRDALAFYGDHRWYLWLSAGQWAFGLAYVVLTLLAWRAEDRISEERIRRGPLANELLAGSEKNRSETIGEQNAF